jgi:hypothetical protein
MEEPEVLATGWKQIPLRESVPRSKQGVNGEGNNPPSMEIR